MIEYENAIKRRIWMLEKFSQLHSRIYRDIERGANHDVHSLVKFVIEDDPSAVFNISLDDVLAKKIDA